MATFDHQESVFSFVLGFFLLFRLWDPFLSRCWLDLTIPDSRSASGLISRNLGFQSLITLQNDKLVPDFNKVFVHTNISFVLDLQALILFESQFCKSLSLVLGFFLFIVYFVLHIVFYILCLYIKEKYPARDQKQIWQLRMEVFCLKMWSLRFSRCCLSILDCNSSVFASQGMELLLVPISFPCTWTTTTITLKMVIS
jgi:hypothetical protein